MPFLYICPPCFRRDNTDIFFTLSDKGPLIICPTCNNRTAEFKYAYKNKTKKTKFARSVDEAMKRAGRASRSGRGVPKAEYRSEQFETPKIAEVGLQYDPEMDEGAEVDEEYVPQVDFNPAMRFTDPSWGNAVCRDPMTATGLVQTALAMATVDHRITAKAGRGDTGTTMAQALPVGKLKKVSAYTWANWGQKPPNRGMAYTVNKKRSLEWCHLLADSLGGPTQADNLVAASYGANTFMMTIEEKLNARTNLVIQVTAHCSRDHVAEFVYYTIKKSNAQHTWIIDGRNDSFSQADYQHYGQQVVDFIK
jgi:hypothetical protein